GSPALASSRSDTRQVRRSLWMSIRHTVGGAQKLVTRQRTSCSSSARASKRSYWYASMVACAFQGAKKLDQACFAQPGELRFRCTSPGCSPSQYMVDRCPTG